MADSVTRITAFLHASLLVADLGRARSFYEGVLGLAPSPRRPDLGFDGVWYEIGPQQIHLLVQPNSSWGPCFSPCWRYPDGNAIELIQLD